MIREALEKIARSPHGTLHCELVKIAGRALETPCAERGRHTWGVMREKGVHPDCIYGHPYRQEEQ